MSQSISILVFLANHDSEWGSKGHTVGANPPLPQLPSHTSTPYTLSTMVATRKSNAQAHPGQILLNNQQTRRTRKQIEEDEARANAASTAKKNQAAEQRRQRLANLAQLDEVLEKDDATLHQHSTRPDLVTEDIMGDLYGDDGQQSEDKSLSSENMSEGDIENLQMTTSPDSSDLDGYDHAGVESGSESSDGDREITNTGRRNARKKSAVSVHRL
jgi:hypothetical protein